MAIDLLLWAILGGLAGFGLGYFWDEIKAWATRVIKKILDGINYAIEVTSKAIVYLVQEGLRYYKRVEIYVRNIRTGNTRLLSERQEISESEIPDEILDELTYKAHKKLKLMESNT